MAALNTYATFLGQSVTAFSHIGAAYSTGQGFSAARQLFIDNQTNGDVQVSLDGGTTDHFHVPAGRLFTIILDLIKWHGTGTLAVKDGATASTAGSLYFTQVL